MPHFMLKPGLKGSFGRTCATRRIVFQPSVPVSVDEDEAAILAKDVGHALVEVTLEQIPGIAATRPRPQKPVPAEPAKTDEPPAPDEPETTDELSTKGKPTSKRKTKT